MSIIINNKGLTKALTLGAVLLAGSFQVNAEDQNENWYTNIEYLKIDAKITAKDNMLGFTIGYQYSPTVSFEGTSRNVINSEHDGELNSLMLIWRSGTQGAYYKLGTGYTFSSGDIFDCFTASFSIGGGYKLNEKWSVELDALRISDDVKALSFTTHYRF